MLRVFKFWDTLCISETFKAMNLKFGMQIDCNEYEYE